MFTTDIFLKPHKVQIVLEGKKQNYFQHHDNQLGSLPEAGMLPDAPDGTLNMLSPTQHGGQQRSLHREEISRTLNKISQ